MSELDRVAEIWEAYEIMYGKRPTLAQLLRWLARPPLYKDVGSP